MIPAYPLQWPAGWPRARDRKRAAFNKKTTEWVAPAYQDGHGYTKTRTSSLSVSQSTERVLYELQRLGVLDGDAIISTNLQRRLDGLPRSDQPPPDDPGVAVYWQKRGAPMRVLAIDRYDRVADNLAAIAATLEAMRSIDRHGGAQILERAFTGFDALPAPASCWEVLGISPGAGEAEIKAAYRNKAARAHPDTGGSHDEMARLNRARDDALGGMR